MHGTVGNEVTKWIFTTHPQSQSGKTVTYLGLASPHEYREPEPYRSPSPNLATLLETTLLD